MRRTPFSASRSSKKSAVSFPIALRSYIALRWSFPGLRSQTREPSSDELGGAERAAPGGDGDVAQALRTLSDRFVDRRLDAPPRHQHVDRLDDEEEDDGGDHEERDHGVDERPVEEVALVDGEAEAAEVRLAADRGDQRRDEIRDEGADGGGEREADDDADGHVDEVAAKQELLEVLHAGSFPTPGARRVSHRSASRNCANCVTTHALLFRTAVGATAVPDMRRERDNCVAKEDASQGQPCAPLATTAKSRVRPGTCGLRTRRARRGTCEPVRGRHVRGQTRDVSRGDMPDQRGQRSAIARWPRTPPTPTRPAPVSTSTARRIRSPTYLPAAATSVAMPQYQASVPTATPRTTAAAFATESVAPAGTAAGNAIVHSAIVNGFSAVAATAVANAVRGATTSSSTSRPARARTPVQRVRAPMTTRIDALASANASRIGSPLTSRPTPARPTAAYKTSIAATALAIARPTAKPRRPRSTDRIMSKVTGPICAAKNRPRATPAAASAVTDGALRAAARLGTPPPRAAA